MKYTRDEMYAFVWRADTFKKIHIAEEWLKAHFEDIGDVDLWDDLMVQLAWQANDLGKREYIL